MGRNIFEKDISALTGSFYKKRDCYEELKDFIENGRRSMICALYGLRRTGKSVLMEQMAQELSANGVPCLYLECKKGATMYELDNILMDSYKKGIRHVFIDEITALQDFQSHSASLADVFAAQGMRIVVAGTDSLGITFAGAGELLDRVKKIHTSYISQGEYRRLLGKSIDDYITYGGTLIDTIYKEHQAAEEYYNSAIVSNIINSIEKNEGVWRYPPELTELYENDEIVSTLNKMIGLMNQSMLVKAIAREFKSGPLNQTIRNMDRDKFSPLMDENENRGFFYRDVIDIKVVTMRVRNALNIKENSELTTKLTAAHVDRLKNYLVSLGLLLVTDSYLSLKDMKADAKLEIIMQPGMVYSHVTELVEQLKKNNVWAEAVEAKDRKEFEMRADRAVRGIILENAVLANVLTNYRDDKELYVSKLTMDLHEKRHEADMLMVDDVNGEVYEFEVKYSDKVVLDHLKHLNHDGFQGYIGEHFGHVVEKFLIYNGPSGVFEGVNHINADTFFDTIYRHKDNWREAIQELCDVAHEKGELQPEPDPESLDDKIKTCEGMKKDPKTCPINRNTGLDEPE